MKYICAKLKQLCNTMKPYTAGIHTILIVLLTLFCAYLEYKLRVTKDSLSWVISSMNPEERISYDSQQFKNPYDLSTIFTFMGVIFGLFSFLTFQSVKDFFASKIKDVEDKYKEAKKEYEDQKHKLIELENNVSYQMSTFYFSRTDHAEGSSLFDYVFFNLKGCECLAKILVNPINENELFVSANRSIISKKIIKLSEKLTDETSISVTENELSTERLKTLQERISKILDGEDHRLLNEIFGKIKIVPAQTER